MEFYIIFFFYFTPVLNAAIYNHFDIVKFLSNKSGFDPNYKRKNVFFKYKIHSGVLK